MSALVKIFASTSRASRYVQFEPSEGTEFHPTRELMGMAISRKDVLEANKTFAMSLGTLTTDNYHALVSLNPHLAPHVTNLTLSSAWNPTTTGPLWVSFKAIRTIDLASIGPLLTVYLVD